MGNGTGVYQQHSGTAVERLKMSADGRMVFSDGRPVRISITTINLSVGCHVITREAFEWLVREAQEFWGDTAVKVIQR